MESIINAAGKITNFYGLAAVGIIVLFLLPLAMIRYGQLTKLSRKDSFKYILLGTMFPFSIILVSIFLGFFSKDISNKAASNDTGTHFPDVTASDARNAGQDIVPERHLPQPALIPTPPSVVTSSPTLQNAPTQGRDSSSTPRIQQAPSQPLMRPTQQSEMPSETREQIDPVLTTWLQALRNLSDRGVRIERSFSQKEGAASCVNQFETWREDCVRILNQVDDYFDHVGHPTDFSHYFYSNANQLVSKQHLMMFPVEDSFDQCRSGFRTSAQSLLGAIDLDIRAKVADIKN